MPVERSLLETTTRWCVEILYFTCEHDSIRHSTKSSVINLTSSIPAGNYYHFSTGYSLFPLSFPPCIYVSMIVIIVNNDNTYAMMMMMIVMIRSTMRLSRFINALLFIIFFFFSIKNELLLFGDLF